MLGLDNSHNTGSFVYPDNYADAALRGTLDTRPGSRAIRLFMLSLDQDLAAELRAKGGLVADDENQLKVQALPVPDVTAVAFRRFSTCNMEQLKNALRRAALSAETVDTLITEFEGQMFKPAAAGGLTAEIGSKGGCEGSCRCESSGELSRCCCQMTLFIIRR